jgi:hypothetical protein
MVSVGHGQGAGGLHSTHRALLVPSDPESAGHPGETMPLARPGPFPEPGRSEAYCGVILCSPPAPHDTYSLRNGP